MPRLNQKTAKRLRRKLNWREGNYEHTEYSMQMADLLRFTLRLTATCGKGIYRRLKKGVKQNINA